MSTGELIENEGTESNERPSEQGMAIATSRQSQEVQAAMIVARRFPRDETKAIARIIQSCKRKGLAENSQYEYTRGGTLITGPSIRLAEVLAQCWGNLDFGVVELERRFGESVAMAYCWDLETNVRQTKVFTVRHVRDTKKGQTTLRDERDIYETVANNGARRLRNCILGIIPGDIQDIALEECDKTLIGKNTEPLIDRVRKMVLAFGEVGVKPEMIELKLNHRLEVVTPRELVKLGRFFTAIRDGIATIEEHFPPVIKDEKQSLKTITTELEGGKPAPPKATEQPKPNFDELFAACQAELLATVDLIPAQAVRDKYIGPDSNIPWPEEYRGQIEAMYAAHVEGIRKARGQKAKQGTLMETGATAEGM